MSELVDRDRLAKAIEHPAQAVLNMSVVAIGQSGRMLLKRSPEIVEGDPIRIEINLGNPKQMPFPGGKVNVRIEYARDQDQSFVWDVPPIKPAGEISLSSEALVALHEGMANMYVEGMTEAHQRIFFLADNNRICIPQTPVALFRVWPLSAIYSTITILLAGISLMIAAAALLISIVG